MARTNIDVSAIRDRIGDRLVVASVSGGKDSATMSLFLRELGIEHVRVFADTGWEHPTTYAYVRGELTRVLGPIHEVRGLLQMEDLIRKKAMFPSRVRRFCTTDLKVKPLVRFVEAMAEETGREPLNVVGIRAAESEARRKLPEWEYSDAFDCEVWRPLINWSEADVIAMHHAHGLAPNPLYLQGARRVGCWPCIFARKDEIRMVAETDPARIDLIRDLEEESNEAARARYAARGDVLDHRRSFFQTRQSTVAGGYAPIDDVVRWSRTTHGGVHENRQVELFAGHDGCARWGLCESLPDDVADPED